MPQRRNYPFYQIVLMCALALREDPPGHDFRFVCEFRFFECQQHFEECLISRLRIYSFWCLICGMQIGRFFVFHAFSLFSVRACSLHCFNQPHPQMELIKRENAGRRFAIARQTELRLLQCSDDRTCVLSFTTRRRRSLFYV